MSNINVVQSFWNFAQFNKIKKLASSQNLKSPTQKTKFWGNNAVSGRFEKFSFNISLFSFLFRLKRFMSVFCKRRGADDFFLMVNLPAVSVFTFYLFWVKTPLSQHRGALLCSKMEIQISHENEWFDIFFSIFVIHFTKGTFFINHLYA